MTVLLISANSGHAANRTWDGGTTGLGTDLSTAANWFGDTAPSAGDTLQWSGGVSGILGLTFSSSFGGATSGMSIYLTGSQTSNLSINSSTAGIAFRVIDITVDSGAGALSIGTSGTTFTFAVGGSGATSHTWTNNSSSTVVIGSKATLSNGGTYGQTLTITGSGNWLIAGNLSDAVSGANSITLTKAGSGTLTLSGNNTTANGWGGTLSINEGAVCITNSGALGTTGNSTSGGTKIGNSATSTGKLQLSGGIITGEYLSVAGRGNSTAALIENISGNNTLNGTFGLSIVSGSANYNIVSDSGTLTLAGSMAVGSGLTGDRNFNLGGNGDGVLSMTLASLTSGSWNLFKTGSGTWIIGSAQDNVGSTTVNSGTLQVNGSIVNSTVSVGAGAALAGSGTTSGTVAVNGGAINGNGLKLGTTTFTGASTLSGVNTANFVTVQSGSTSLTGTTTSSTVSVSAGAILADNGVINGGVTVSGLLKGAGTTNGTVSLTSGTLAPGNSPGTTTINGNFTMDTTSVLAMEVTGTASGAYDQVVVNGNVLLAGTLDLTSLSGLTLGDTITLVSNIGTETTTSGYFTEIITSGSTYTVSGSSNTYMFEVGSTEYVLNYAAAANGDGYANDVTLTVVPEPSTWAMLAGGFGLLLGCQSLRRRQD